MQRINNRSLKPGNCNQCGSCYFVRQFYLVNTHITLRVERSRYWYVISEETRYCLQCNVLSLCSSLPLSLHSAISFPSLKKCCETHLFDLVFPLVDTSISDGPLMLRNGSLDCDVELGFAVDIGVIKFLLID